MDDFQLAFGASGKIGDLYKEGKTFSRVAPAYALCSGQLIPDTTLSFFSA